MQTIYIDVYFLINFTVDLLSLHLASRFTKIPVLARRILFAALIGGAYAAVLVFLPQNIFFFSVLTLFFGLLMMLISTRGVGVGRKIKFTAAFLFFQITIGGCVYFCYGIFDKYIGIVLNEECGTNRDILILSLIVLLSIGVLKIFILAFSNRISEKSVRLKIVLEDKEYISEAFVDTGNLLKDPFDLSPVLLINKSFAERIFPKKLPNISSVSNINDSLKGCFRIIPIKTSTGSKALAGFKPDAVFVLKDKKSERINLTVAIDEEGGSYGGFDALISAAALDNIR